MLGSAHDAGDAVQETLIRAWRALYRIATSAMQRARTALDLDRDEPAMSQQATMVRPCAVAVRQSARPAADHARPQQAGRRWVITYGHHSFPLAD